jgi:Zn-dependent M28 family amino/carboxypeptidase
VKDDDRKQGQQTGSRRLGPHPRRSERAKSYANSHRTLVASEFLAIALLAVSGLGYIQSRPNTAGCALEGSFDCERAFADVRRLVAFGPRPSGSEALERTREFIIAELRAAGASVVRDKFTASTPLGPIPMSNIVAKIPGDSSAVVIIAGHYDTKRSKFPFLGANDGGSSAAFLLEMAPVLVRRKNSLSFWLLFFDGEEALRRWSDTDGLCGSRHFAQKLSAEGTLSQVRALILVDMIADAHLDVHREAHSTPWLSDIVFAQARRLGYGRYFLNSLWAVEDDHIPFVERGVSAVDIIDLDYGPFNFYWHTRYDTVGECSPASLAIVARVVLATLAALETNLPFQSRGAS